MQEWIDQAAKLMPSEKSREDLHHNMQLLLQSAISKIDLVTREEFDAQTAVLHKMQARVEKLESQLALLTEQLENNNNQ